MLLSLFYGMVSCVVSYRCNNKIQNFFLQKMSLFFPIIIASNTMSLFYSPSFSSFSSHYHFFYLWHTVEDISSDDYKSPVFVDISLSKSWSDHKLPIEQKRPKKTKEDATKLMIERKKLTKLYNLKTFKSRNKHND